MKVGYLVNQYPDPSHTFIRREIRGLEARDVPVERYTIRRSPKKMVDSDDLLELERTHCILDQGLFLLIVTFVTTSLRYPAGVLRALATTRVFIKNSPRKLVQFAYLLEACTLFGFTRKHGIDHLHAHFGTNSAAVAMLCHRLGGPRYSFMVHGPDEFERAQALSLREKVAGASFVAAITQYCQSQIYRWCPYSDWEKVKIVFCGISPRFLDEEPEPIPEYPRVLWVGRMAEEKGIPLLVEACRILAEEGLDFEVLMAGDGPLKGFVKDKITEYGLDKHITLLGWVDDATICASVERSRAVIVPSFAEGLPAVVMETLARGRPAVATQITGIPELVEDGVTGWLVAPGSTESLTDGLRKALTASVEELTRLGQAGRAHALRQHDVRRSTEILEGLMRAAGEQN